MDKDKNVSIEKLVKELQPRKNLMKHYQNDIYLSETQIEILKQYGFSYQNYSNMKSLIFDIQTYLNENYDYELEDLENVVNTLSEFEYYQNTNQ